MKVVLFGVVLLYLVVCIELVSAQGEPYTCSLMFGTYTSDEPFVGNMDGTIDINNKIDRTSYIGHYYQNWGDGSGQWSNVLQFLPILLNFTSAGASNNHLPLLTWQPWAPHFSINPNEIDFPLTNISAGQYNNYIDTWVVGISRLNYTVYLRPMHEMDNGDYPWANVNDNTPQQYIDAWRQIHSRFTAQNVRNVRFVWCPNNSNRKGADQTLYYPGDDYVDWICLDAYASAVSGPASFAKTITDNCNPPQPYGRLTNMTDKPMMIAEFGADEPNGGNRTKGQWFRELNTDLPKFPRIKALIYFNSQVFIINSSADSIAGARAAFGGCSGSAGSFSSGNDGADGGDGGDSASTLFSFIQYFI